jgi:hypothetical protein
LDVEVEIPPDPGRRRARGFSRKRSTPRRDAARLPTLTFVQSAQVWSRLVDIAKDGR